MFHRRQTVNLFRLKSLFRAVLKLSGNRRFGSDSHSLPICALRHSVGCEPDRLRCCNKDQMLLTLGCILPLKSGFLCAAQMGVYNLRRDASSPLRPGRGFKHRCTRLGVANRSVRDRLVAAAKAKDERVSRVLCGIRGRPVSGRSGGSQENRS